jgi:hypothetical protein
MTIMPATSGIIERLRTLYPTHPVVMGAALKLELQARDIARYQATLTAIAGSQKINWPDPVEHANWCVAQAQKEVGV